MRISPSFLLCVLTFCLAAPRVWAADGADNNARPFPSDRPGKANGPFTVDAGHFAVESDFVNFIYDHWANTPTTTQSLTAGDPLLKYGLNSDTDIELQLGGFQHYAVKDRAAGATSRVDGYGDETLRVKHNIAGNDGSDFAVALLPYLKLPTATANLRNAGITNNRIEGGLIVPMNYNLPRDFAAGYETEVDALKNADNGDMHANFVNIASLSHPVPGNKDITATLELYSSISARKSSPDIYTIDPSLAWQVAPNLAFDVETDIGLNRDAPDLQMICGVAWMY